MLVNLTVFVERWASELGEPGAAECDLRDSIEFLRSLPEGGKGHEVFKKEWLPYLESRLHAASRAPLPERELN